MGKAGCQRVVWISMGEIRVSNHQRECGELPGGTWASWAFLAPGRGSGTTPWPWPVCSAALVSQPERGLLLEARLGVFKPNSPFPRLVGFAIQIDVAMDSAPATSDSCS